MEDQEKLVVEGFLFASEEDAKLAYSEEKKIEYIHQNLNYKNLEKVKLLYDRMLDERQFRTPVGWTYLLNLRNLLLKSGMKEEDIRPISTYHSFTAAGGVMKNPARQRVKPKKGELEALKSRCAVSIFLNVLLVICVIGMFYIALKSETPNMVNYRQNIVNEYSSWEQDLTEREHAVREKERELNIH